MRGAREVEQVRALRLVELKRAHQGFEHALRDAGEVPAFQPRVVVDADAGEQSNLLAAETGDAAMLPIRLQPGLVRRDLGAPRRQELADLAPRIHAPSVAPPGES